MWVSPAAFSVAPRERNEARGEDFAQQILQVELELLLTAALALLPTIVAVDRESRQRSIQRAYPPGRQPSAGAQGQRRGKLSKTERMRNRSLTRRLLLFTLRR